MWGNQYAWGGMRGGGGGGVGVWALPLLHALSFAIALSLPPTRSHRTPSHPHAHSLTLLPSPSPPTPPPPHPQQQPLVTREAFLRILALTCQVVTNVALARAHLEAGELRFQDFITDVGALVRKIHALYRLREDLKGGVTATAGVGARGKRGARGGNELLLPGMGAAAGAAGGEAAGAADADERSK